MTLFPLLYMFLVPGCSDKERRPSAHTSSSTKHHPTIVNHPHHTEHTCPSRLRPTLDPSTLDFLSSAQPSSPWSLPLPPPPR